MNDKKKQQAERIQRYAHMIEQLTGKAVRPFRTDGYMNMMNRYGTSKDTTEHYKFAPEPDIPDDSLTLLYEGNGLFAKVIDAPAEEAIKHGFTLKDVSDQEVETFYQEALDELDWEEVAMTGIKWARLFGGAIAVMLINDGGGLEEPLNWKRIKSIDDIRVYDRSVIQPDYSTMFKYDPRDPFRTRGSRLGMPEFYHVNSRYGSFVVHESRCLVFQNGVLPENCSNTNYQLWGMPEYIRIHRAIRDSELAHGTAPKMLDRSVQPVYKMKDLSVLLATDEGESQVLKRLQVIDLARSFLSSLVIDSENEDYDFKSFQFTGVADVIDATCNYLSALTNIPQTILFGRSPAGMNSTGESDLENWYSYVQRIQKRMLKSNLRYLLSVIFQAGVRTGEVDEVPKIKIEFNPLKTMSDSEQADLESKKAATALVKAQTVQLYRDMEVIDSTEIRRSLADSDEFEIDTILDEYESEEDLMAIYEQQEVENPGLIPGLEQAGVEPLGLPSGVTGHAPAAPKQLPTEVAVEKHEADPGTKGSAPANAPAATKLPQDMSEQEIEEITNQDEAPYGVGVLVAKDGRILCGSRHNDTGYGLICGPGGHGEKGETYEQSAIRETQEEFGITPKDLIPVGIGPLEPESGLRSHIFLCTDFDGEVSCADLEMTNPKFRTMEELEDLKPSLFPPFADSLEILKDCLFTDNEDGGSGSGHHNHEGRPEKVGGSVPAHENRKVSEGTDKSRGYSGARDIKSVLKEQGFDGLGKVVSRKQFDEAVKASNFVAQRTYTASSPEILEAYKKHLYNGDFYVECTTGGSQYGKGMYCAADYSGKLTDGIKSEMKHYQELGAQRAEEQLRKDFIKGLSLDDFKENTYSKNLSLSNEELEVYKKLKSSDITGYQLPDKQRKIWNKMMNEKKFTKLNLALADIVENADLSSKAVFTTETITLDPTAKIVKFADITQMQQNEGRNFLNAELNSYADKAGDACRAFYRIQTGAELKDDDFDTVKKWKAEDPEAFKKAEQFRLESVKKMNEVQTAALKMDVGAYAALKGYDAINAEYHGESGSYTVILNRTKCLFLDESRKDGDGDSVITFEQGENGIINAIRDGEIIGWVYASDGETTDKTDGGPGSGNWGHEGRPGKVGGSAEGGGSHNRMGNKQEGFTSFSKNKKKFATPHKADWDEYDNCPQGSILIDGNGKWKKYDNDAEFINIDTGELKYSWELAEDNEDKDVRILVPDDKNPNFKKMKVRDDDRFSSARKKAAFHTAEPQEADDIFREQSGRIWKEASDDARNALYNYTGHSYSDINDCLRSGSQPTEKIGQYIKNMTETIGKSELQQDTFLYRGIDRWALSKMLNVDYEAMGKQNPGAYVGKEISDNAFMSCSSAEGMGFDGSGVYLKIYCPAGTKAMYAEPFSKYGNGAKRDWDGESRQTSFSKEFETILQRGTRMQITNMTRDEYNSYVVECQVVAQEYE